MPSKWSETGSFNAAGPPADQGNRQGAIPRAIASYDRRRDLAPLLALWPWEIKDLDESTQPRIIAMIGNALRIERQRGVTGHWAYDVARHARLVRAYKAECQSVIHPDGARAVARGPGPISRPDACRDPFSWPAPSGQPHNSEQPSGSRAAGPTSRDTLPETGCSGCADAASAT